MQALEMERALEEASVALKIYSICLEAVSVVSADAVQREMAHVRVMTYRSRLRLNLQKLYLVVEKRLG